MIGSLFKIIVFFFIIYFIFNAVRGILAMSRKMSAGRKEYENRSKKQGPDGKVIELDKNQYKVE
jgi:uncharacterized protein HemY